MQSKHTLKPVTFKECNAKIAENQKEYFPIPARIKGDANGEIIFCWRLSWIQRIKVLFTGKIWHSVWTFNTPLQPQKLETLKPNF